MLQHIGIALNLRWVQSYSVWGLWVRRWVVVPGGVEGEFSGSGIDDDVEVLDED